MKKKGELNVDVIGGLGPLTSKEEKELSLFFKKRKLKAKRRRLTKSSKEKAD